MQEGILNEPVREAADQLLTTFSDQMRLPFTNLMFITVAEDGTFRTANYAKAEALTADAVRGIAKHLNDWADTFGEEA
jgi:hypothetical protein